MTPLTHTNARDNLPVCATTDFVSVETKTVNSTHLFETQITTHSDHSESLEIKSPPSCIDWIFYYAYQALDWIRNIARRICHCFYHPSDTNQEDQEINPIQVPWSEYLYTTTSDATQRALVMTSTVVSSVHQSFSSPPPSEEDLGLQSFWKYACREIRVHTSDSAILQFLDVDQDASQIRLFLHNSEHHSLLQKVTTLNLSWSTITTIPPEISCFTQLERLVLSNNQVETLPESINQLIHLTEMDLSHNQISHLPELNLPNLTHCNLSYNQLSSLPTFSGCPKLTRLNLSYNQFTLSLSEIESSFWWAYIAVMPALQTILLESNPVIEYPKTILDFEELSLSSGHHTGIYQPKKNHASYF